MGKRNQQQNSEGDVLKHIIASLDLPPVPAMQSVVAGRHRKSGSKFQRPDWGGKFIGLYQGSSTIEKLAADQVILVNSGLPELPAGYSLKVQPMEPVLARTVSAKTIQRNDLVEVGAIFYGLTRIIERVSGFFASTLKMVSQILSGVGSKRLARNRENSNGESLSTLGKKILKRASTDVDLRFALLELNELKMQVRAQHLTPENMGCSGKVLEAILKSAKALQYRK